MKKLLPLLCLLSLLTSCTNSNGDISLFGWFLISVVIMVVVVIISLNTPAEKARREAAAKDLKAKMHQATCQYEAAVKEATVVLSSTSDAERSLGVQGEFVAFYDNNSGICFYSNGVKVEIPYSSIRGVEVVIDNDVAYEKSGVGRAVVGGLLAGGAGAVVGAVTGKTTKKEDIKSVAVVVRLKELSRPSFMFSLYNEVPGTTKESRRKVSALAAEFAAKIVDTIGVILDRE